MRKNNQKGFSLIELLLVVVIIGIVAAIAVPSLTKAVAAAENGAAISVMKAMFVSSATIYSQKSRYARLDEINAFQNGTLGTLNSGGTVLSRGKYDYEMVPLTPTDAQLKSEYEIKGARVVDAVQLPFVLNMDQTGQVVQTTP